MTDSLHNLRSIRPEGADLEKRQTLEQTQAQERLVLDSAGWEVPLENFRRWLESLEDIDGLDVGPAPEPLDFRSLFAGFVTIREEIRLQNRARATVTREIEKVSGELEKVSADSGEVNQGLQKVFESTRQTSGEIRYLQQLLGEIGQQIRKGVEEQFIRGILDVRDALVRGHNAQLAEISRPLGFFESRKHRNTTSAEGYELAIRRVDRLLSEHGVSPILSDGMGFDPRTMRAVELRDADRDDHDKVVETLIGGFQRDDQVLRLADVVVGKHPESGGNDAG